VVNKIEDPVMVWESGDVVPAGDWRNSFGTRWLGLGDWSSERITDYGIHGTNSPEAIGREISLGCVRMYNWDAQAVYEQLDVGALVVIK
jgi:lipoprotein-anchoring transpeptidase ErfK/SrfK